MKKRPTNEDSDEFDVDEPEEFEESGSDWDPEEEEAGKKRKGRAKITPKKPASNKKKKIETQTTLEDEEGEENEAEEDEESDEEAAEAEQTNGITAPNVSLRAFTNGSFVVLKSDVKTKENPPLWKIDGKALLQKYVPFEQDGKILYKNTSTYSGWTPSNQDQYSPAPVTYIEHGKKEIIIEFNKSSVEAAESPDGARSESSTTAES